MVVLMILLFWGLWDEAFLQRPWKSFQNGRTATAPF